MIKANLHTHSLYCDGKASLREVAETAIQKGFSILGFSSHAPVPFQNSFSIKDDNDLLKYVKEIHQLQKEFNQDIRIYLSLEIDYIPQVTRPFSDFRNTYHLDYTIGSVHLVKNDNDELWFIDGPDPEIYDEGLNNGFGGDIYKGVKAYFDQINEMITTEKPDMVGHLDKIKMHNKSRYFEEDEIWYKKLVDEALDYIKANDTILEVNTRGIYRGRCRSLFPGREILKKAQKMNIPISLNSDAHKPHELDGYYPEARNILTEVGYSEVYYFNDDNWKAYSLR